MPSSRREFLAGSALALIGGALARPSLARAIQQAPNPVFTTIRRGVGFFTGRGGTIGYLINATGVVVVDSQYPDTAKLCLDGLNERSGSRPVDRLINTHHHGDHTAGNIVFKGVARKVVAHARAAEHMRQPPGRAASTAEQLYPDTTYSDVWREQIGDEWVRAKHHGRGHTGGDGVITFENANVAHMGDLMFNRRHPVIDRPAGASIRNWATILESTVAEHDADTVFIFGHAGGEFPVTGSSRDLTHFASYLRALLAFTQSQITAGRSQTDVTAIREPLAGFDEFGPLNATVLGNAWGEISEGTGTAR
jgi:glyoxylase-like metal-dependent hydrolase (beta-lactamase superfamily II)